MFIIRFFSFYSIVYSLILKYIVPEGQNKNNLLRAIFFWGQPKHHFPIFRISCKLLYFWKVHLLKPMNSWNVISVSTRTILTSVDVATGMIHIFHVYFTSILVKSSNLTVNSSFEILFGWKPSVNTAERCLWEIIYFFLFLVPIEFTQNVQNYNVCHATIFKRKFF